MNTIDQQIQITKKEIQSEEANPLPNSTKLAYLYSNLNRLKESMRNINNKKYWAKV